MADLNVFPDRLEISLTAAEKTLARRRDDVIIERADIASVAITDDPWIWLRGIRSPGTIIPLTLAVGTWKFHGGKDFVLLKGKKRHAVVIDLEGGNAEFQRVIVATPHVVRLTKALRTRKPEEIAPDGESI